MPRKVSDTPSSPSSFSEGTYYKVVRLKTGETLLCMMSKDVKSIATEMHLTLIRPVMAAVVKEMKQGTESGMAEIFRFRPWIGLSDSTEMVIGVEIVLTVCNMRANIVAQYLRHLEEVELAELYRQRIEETAEREEAIGRLLSSISSDGKTVRYINEGS